MAKKLEEYALVARPERDNVAVMITDVTAPGAKAALEAQWQGRVIALRPPLRRGASVALCDLQPGDAVISLGAPYGIAKAPIAAGSVVDERNLAAELPKGLNRGMGMRVKHQAPRAQLALPAQFSGFAREDGQAGTRNYVAVVTSGMCAAAEVREIAARASRELWSRERYPQVDGVVPIVQESGCGMPDGEPVEILNRVLTATLAHPNLGAVLYVDLGCGKTCIACSAPVFAQRIPGYQRKVRLLSIQGSGGTRGTIERGLAEVDQLLELANQARRTPTGIEKLKLGVKCGGSDRWSGITANPALGWAADQLIAAGGSVLIGEVPELQGAAAQALKRRAANRETARKWLAAQRRYEKYVGQFGQDYRENPSPGNIAGGLANIYLKSLGALAKAGESPLTDVPDYAEPAGERRGLMVVYSPGYDQISTPALFMGGAQVVCFTTGRGTGIGCALGPVIKISSNSELARGNEDIDLDAGTILPSAGQGTWAQPDTIAGVGEKILRQVMAISNGDSRPKAEASGLHYEFKVWESLWPSL